MWGWQVIVLGEVKLGDDLKESGEGAVSRLRALGRRDHESVQETLPLLGVVGEAFRGSETYSLSWNFPGR